MGEQDVSTRGSLSTAYSVTKTPRLKRPAPPLFIKAAVLLIVGSVCALSFNCDNMVSDLGMVSGYQGLEHSSWV